ncbi:immune inhibitor A domain-containing protein [Vibrio cionasavignyae]|uniref:immune inhibitor A domain-containing protein n=1 Tax=Vibrio cionasavignyae TaxID=2910252 RepID=UPI003D113A08
MNRITLLATCIAGVISPALLVAAPAAPTRSIDLNTINHEHILNTLNGTTILAASEEADAEQALHHHLNHHQHLNDTGALDDYEQRRNQRLRQMMTGSSLTMTESTATNNETGVHTVLKAGAWNGPITRDKVLALLIEFPDYPVNTVTADETSNYYDDYPATHYADMLFGQQGYVGSNGETLLSMVQFYEAQSGGSYSQYGEVSGWYTAQFPAAYYGAQNGSINDINARALVREALLAADKDPNINLSDFDLEDRYDIDGDGNLREPDGLVDHVMIFHSAVGQEAGGGALGSDAIWSHRWNLGSLQLLPNSPATVPNWNGLMAAYDYTIQPIDAAAGVAAHEYGHDLGLPDEYDTVYGQDEYGTTPGEPVSYWSIMSSGSWAGLIPGSEPTAFSPWAREFLQRSLGGNWFNVKTVSSEALTTQPQRFELTHAANRNEKLDAIKVELPNKSVKEIDPIGSHAYFSGRGNNLNTLASFEVDLTQASTATLSFMVHYSIEQDYDFGRVLVNGAPIAGSITTDSDPFQTGHGIGFTGQSDGWQPATFDLSAYAGQSVTISFNYFTDLGYIDDGFWFDDVSVTSENGIIKQFSAENEEPDLTLLGMTRNSGSFEYEHYYLVEWRQHQGVDKGLAHINRSGSLMSFDPGMVVWYVDTSFTDNGVTKHPGEGWLGVVDADRNPQIWSNGTPATTRYQVRDAAFNIQAGSIMNLLDRIGNQLHDPYIVANPMFIDWEDYSNPIRPATGKQLPQYGLIFNVVAQHSNGRDATLELSKVW